MTQRSAELVLLVLVALVVAVIALSWGMLFPEIQTITIDHGR